MLYKTRKERVEKKSSYMFYAFAILDKFIFVSFNAFATIHFADKLIHVVQGRDIPIVHRVIEV